MTAAAELLTYLRSAGYEVDGTAEGGLVVNPRSKLSAAEIDQVRALKPELLALVAAERWRQCVVCRAGIDPAFVFELGRVCPAAGCPYRRRR